MTTLGEEPAMGPAVARLIERRVPDVPPEPSLWRTPARVAAVASAIVIAVTTNLPWLHQEGIGQTEVLSGNSGYADGTLLTFIAVVTSVVVANRDVARSRTWLLRWLPAILGIVGLLFVLSAVRSMENQIAIWRRFGATGVYEPGFFVFIAAGIVFGVAATWIGLRRGRARTTGGVANERLVISRSTVLSSVISLAGLAIGTLAGGAVALSLDIDRRRSGCRSSAWRSSAASSARSWGAESAGCCARPERPGDHRLWRYTRPRWIFT